MLEIDCRICKNLGNDECKLYGRDPDVAVKKCAENGFKDYRPSRQRKNKKEGRHERNEADKTSGDISEGAQVKQ